MDDDPSIWAQVGAPAALFSWFLIGTCLILETLCAAFEAAVSILGRERIQELAAQDRSLRRAGKLLRSPERLLPATAVASIVLLFSAQALAAHHVLGLMGNRWIPLLVTPALALVFCEVVPTLFAFHHPVSVLRWSAPVVSALVQIVRPFVTPRKTKRGSPADGSTAPIAVTPSMTEDDLRQVLTVARRQGSIAEHERAMIQQAIEFADKRVAEVMVPWNQVVALPASAPLRLALRTMVECGHSRVPVSGERPSETIGVLYAKDLVRHLLANEGDRPSVEVARAPFAIPGTAHISDLLDQFQQRRRLMAIVLDEAGLSAGIVTMEDLLEEIVGEILEEADLGSRAARSPARTGDRP